MISIANCEYKVFEDKLFSHEDAKRVYDSLSSHNTLQNSELNLFCAERINWKEKGKFEDWSANEICLLQWIIFAYVDQKDLQVSEFVLLANIKCRQSKTGRKFVQ